MKVQMFLATALVAALGGCGSDDAPAADAQVGFDASVPIDARRADAGEPDAFDPCPGEATFELGVVDWVSGENIAGVVVEESEGNGASSAPNGRVVVCVPASGIVNFRFSKADYLDRIHTTTVEAIAAQYATGVAPTFRLLKTADADALYDGVKTVRDEAATTVITMATDAATGLPLAGVTPSLTASNDGSYVPDGTGAATGTTSGTDGRVLFLNTELGKEDATEVMATGPSSCDIPQVVALEAGVSSVALPCVP